MSTTRLFCAGVALSVLVAVVGCGRSDSGLIKVAGEVFYKGAPVDGATVMFSPVDLSSGAEAAAGLTDASGVFTVSTASAVQGGSGTKPGDYYVLISKRTTTVSKDQAAFDSGEITYDELQKRKASNPYASSGAKTTDHLPVKYSQPPQGGKGSDLRATVKAGENKFKFELTD
ncbi:MAG: hypothetical protein ACRC46_12240 [Thermoguttaceae bacterium]